MKRFGFLSFGHYRNVIGARVPDAGTSMRNHVELAVAAEAAGLDGAFVRVHHFDESLASPFPLLSAMAARTTTLTVGTGVLDLRYENPLMLAENAAATDLLSSGRLALGVSRGSPENAADGQAAFGIHLPAESSWAERTRDTFATFRRAINGEPVAHSHRAVELGRPHDLVVQPQSPGLDGRLWWGAGSHSTGVWAGEQGLNLISSTLLLQDDGRPFHVQQADQVRAWRAAYEASGARGPKLSAVTRSAFPITNAEDQAYFGRLRRESASDGIGFLDGGRARSGPTFAGSVAEVAELLASDEAVNEADWVLFALPSHLGVAHNAHLFENLAAVRQTLGWD